MALRDQRLRPRRTKKPIAKVQPYNFQQGTGANAKKVERVGTKPAHFYCLYSECNGKYGWFDASKNIYNMAEYHTGWAFETQELYNEFLNIK